MGYLIRSSPPDQSPDRREGTQFLSCRGTPGTRLGEVARCRNWGVADAFPTADRRGRHSWLARPSQRRRRRWWLPSWRVTCAPRPRYLLRSVRSILPQRWGLRPLIGAVSRGRRNTSLIRRCRGGRCGAWRLREVDAGGDRPGVVADAGGSGGEADRAGAGVVHRHGARVPVALRWDPAGAAATCSRSAESCGAGGGLPRAGGGPVDARSLRLWAGRPRRSVAR